MPGGGSETIQPVDEMSATPVHGRSRRDGFSLIVRVRDPFGAILSASAGEVQVDLAVRACPKTARSTAILAVA